MDILQMVNKGFRSDINALRALAVIGVIGYHFGVPGFSGGFAGVDVFFVISGYLITLQIQQALEAGKFRFGEFYVSRLRRIFPALVVMCCAIMLFDWWFVFPSDYIQHAKSAFQALYFGSNYGFMNAGANAGYFESVNIAQSPLLHTWSLSIEGQYYLFFPLFLVFVYKKVPIYYRTIVLMALLLAVVYFFYDFQSRNDDSFYRLSVRTWEFLVGACLVILPKIVTKLWVSNTGNLIGLLALISSMHLLDAKVLWPSYLTMWPVLATVLIIGFSKSHINNWLFNNRFIQRTGDMSYSLYLWHWPLIVFAKQYVSIYDRQLNMTELAALFLATYVLAYLSWRLIERPVRISKKIWTAKVIFIAFLSLVACFWGGWRWLDLTKGQPSRLESHLSQMTAEEMLRPPKYGSTCMDDQRVAVDVANIEKCKINEDKLIKPGILLWGDSHMHHYYPAFLKVAKDLSINGIFASRGGCHATLPNVYPHDRYLIEKEANFCIEFNKLVSENYLKSLSIKTVVLARKWFDGESVDQTILLAKEISKSGKKVIIIGALAMPQFHVPQRWLKIQQFSKIAQSHLTLPRAEMSALDNIDKYVKKQLTTEILEHKIVWVEAMDYVCNAKECFFVQNGVNSYWDGSHLTESKALEFVDEFKRALKE
jgi:peptidoglycan/LPS O-acetylase OafA/YrhL